MAKLLLNAYCTHREPPPLGFPHRLLSRRDRSDRELAPHLNGFMGFVMDRGRRPMNQTRFHVLGHISRVRHHLALEVDEAEMSAFEAWATQANALIFLPDGSVRSPNGAVLVGGPAGDAEPGAYVPYPRDAGERKLRTEKLLASRAIPFAKTLPPVVSEVEVDLQDAAAIVRRCQGLFLCAVRAESLAAKEPVPVEELRQRSPEGYAALTPKERSFIDSPEPDEQQVVNHVWRYESLAVLAWSVSALAELPFPEAICEVPAVARAALHLAEATPRLRTSSEILDALDLHYRLHWATTDARVSRREPPPGLEPGVVFERHYALNWLTRFQDEDWDDVETPT